MPTWSVVADIDSFLYNQSPDANYGSAENFNTTVIIIGGSKTVWQRGILNFDLSSFPGDVADFTAAKLTVDLIGVQNTGEQVDFERCTRPADWVESEVTWNEYSSGNSWTAAGGDKTDVDRVTTTIPASTGIKGIPGFKTLVEDAIDNRSDILSLIMRMDDESGSGSSRTFQVRSTEATAGEPPTLEITYASPDTGRRSVPRSPFGETARSARPAAPGRAFAGARTAQPSRPQRRRPR